MFYPLAPLLTERDAADSAEGGIDPLGLYPIADALGVRLVPGVRERQRHPRFLTAIAVSLALCDAFEEDTVASDGATPPWLVFEWYVVEGLMRNAADGETIGLPGSLKAAKAIADRVPLSAKRYLKAPAVVGFHGVYRLLAQTLGIETGGRLGEAGFDLLNTWAKERGLEGFGTSADGPGRDVFNELRKAVEKGLKAGATAQSQGWRGWPFFREHLGLYSAGRRESRWIAAALRTDNKGWRGTILDFLVSTEGRAGWQNEDERKFHAALHRRADESLRMLLDAISVYETFARLCQDAFDDALCEMTRCGGGKTSPGTLGQLPSIQLASRRVPDLFGEVCERLEPFPECARFRDAFAGLAERGSPSDWMSRLAEHHKRVQYDKPPDGKNPWFDRFDDGSLIIRPLYRRDTPGRHDDSYVHAYRTRSLWSFAGDLGLIR